MMVSDRLRRISWSNTMPVIAVLVLALLSGRSLGPVLYVLVGIALTGAVLAAVHHAEAVAHRVGEPFGSLVLAVAVTIIEVALIVTLMVSGESASLARDTVFAAVMITANGIVGLSLLVGARRFDVAVFNAEGAGAALATLVALATLSLVLPTFTTSEPGPQFSGAQLTFAAGASLILYGLFVMTQTVRHRDFFLPVAPVETADAPADHVTVAPLSRSLAFLLMALVGVVGLAKLESSAIEAVVRAFGLPASFVGVVIALLVLLPESIAAVRASMRNEVQISLNLAFGSAIASIGLTIPAIAVASIWLDGPLVLGLGPTQIVMLVLTVLISVLTIVPGRATRLQGGVHLTLLAAFIFLAINP